MKGLIFREFLEMIELKSGYELVDEILLNTSLESKGIYTTVGTYDHRELFVLATSLSEKTGIPMTQVFKNFGIHVFGVLSKSFSAMIAPYSDPFEFLTKIENTIHVEVLKLYPEAELPTFTIEKKSENAITKIYKSKRRMADFAEGLITGCFEYYNAKAEIEKLPLNDEMTLVKFIIKRTKL